MNLEITREEAEGLAYGDYDNTKYQIIKNDIVDTSRWSGIYELVIKVLETGKYYISSYSKGLTESQDESPYEYGEVLFEEVEPVEQMTIMYVQV
jgi:hypothetical protein